MVEKFKFATREFAAYEHGARAYVLVILVPLCNSVQVDLEGRPFERQEAFPAHF